MSLTIHHNGRPLSKEQLEVYSKLFVEPDFQALSFRRQLAKFDKALKDAGLPVPELKAGDKVSWSSKGIDDSGHIVSVDDRTRKAEVISASVRRKFKVHLDHLRVVEV